MRALPWTAFRSGRSFARSFDSSVSDIWPPLADSAGQGFPATFPQVQRTGRRCPRKAFSRRARARTLNCVAQWVLGGVERRNPLPNGTYWVDVFASKATAFRAWLARNRSSVRVVRTASFPAQHPYEARDWYLFEVRAPVRWEGPGLPTIATPATTPESTVQRPAPEASATETLTTALASIPPLVLLAVLYLLTRKN